MPVIHSFVIGYYVSKGLVLKDKLKAIVDVIITDVSRQRYTVLFSFVFRSENRKKILSALPSEKVCSFTNIVHVYSVELKLPEYARTANVSTFLPELELFSFEKKTC